MAKRSYIGTEELVGATVISVGWDELKLEKDGRVLVLSLEYESDYHSMCEGDCCGSYSSAYFRAEVEG